MCTANPARATRHSIGASTFSPHALPHSVFRMPSGMRPPTVWKWSGRPESSVTSQRGFQYGSESGGVSGGGGAA